MKKFNEAVEKNLERLEQYIPCLLYTSLHRKWITLCWGDYSPEAHANLTQMYVDDERFRSYYDKEQPGSAEFLRDAVKIYTEKI